ncbi:MAG: TIR domain-containing protein [Leptolyngbya sp. SIO4C1]|nr:TIR domain-containing protein [Leptolyngbya sp. SIO4C1]
MAEQFDVFLAHSSKDKPLIRQIYQQLKARGLKPWLDEEEIPPGTSFQEELQQAISQVKTAAICIGEGGLTRWQALELRTFISQCVERKIRVIPVLLPGVKAIPEDLLFLRQFHQVLFENGIEDERAYFRLEWGVTGCKPAPKARAGAKPGTPVVEADDLSSEEGIDYSRLRDLLKAQDWKAADYETYLRMLEAVGRSEGDWIRDEELLNFPCADLLTIDRLWVKYSGGRFGFSVQKQIYVKCGGKLDGKYPGDTIWEKFGESVGWRVDDSWIEYEDVTFDTSASEGHLPGGIFASQEKVTLVGVSSLASRLVKCKA